MAKHTKTIFVGHKPGTFKASYGLTSSGKNGWHVAFLDSENNISYPDGDDIYPYRQGAYRRAKQLNDLMQEKSAQAKTQGVQAGTVSGENWDDRSTDRHDINIAGSHSYRYEFAKRQAREKGYTTEQEIKAYADGYEHAFLAKVMHDDSYLNLI